MSLMRIFRQYLLHCYFSLRETMNSKPNNTKSTSAEKPCPFEILRKAFAKFRVFIWSKASTNIKPSLISHSFTYFDCCLFLMSFTLCYTVAIIACIIASINPSLFFLYFLLFFPLQGMSEILLCLRIITLTAWTLEKLFPSCLTSFRTFGSGFRVMEALWCEAGPKSWSLAWCLFWMATYWALARLALEVLNIDFNEVSRVDSAFVFRGVLGLRFSFTIKCF